MTGNCGGSETTNGSGSQIPDISVRDQNITAGLAGQPNIFFQGSNVFSSVVVELGCGLVGGGDTGHCIDHIKGGAQANSGAYGSLIGFVSDIYKTKPASTDVYVADLMHDMNIAQPAYAQGLGFAALNPILSVWKIFRNIAYFGFVIIFLVIGFMIMFRQKIGSQAVITAQQAIPNIIIALIAVTFSYAIAGLLIDAMYLIMYLIAGLFGRTDLLSGNALEVSLHLITNGSAAGGAEAIGSFVNTLLGNNIVTALAGILTSAVAFLIIAIVIVVNAFRLLISLLKVYVEIILAIAFAPIVLMMGAVPGRNPFGGWIKSLVFNLAVFPTILVFLIIFSLLQNNFQNSQSTAGFLPPYVGGYTGNAANALPFLAGLALILALPDAVEEVKKLGGGGGFFEKLVQTGIKNAQGGFTNIGKAWEAQPLGLPGLDPGYYGRTRGKETAIERLLIGSRAERLRQVDVRAEHPEYVIEPRGLLGALRGQRAAEKAAKQTSQSGAGANTR